MAEAIIVAKQPGNRWLVALPDDQGRIYDADEGQLYQPMPLVSIVARGYWEEVDEVDSAVQAKVEALLRTGTPVPVGAPPLRRKQPKSKRAG